MQFHLASSPVTSWTGDCLILFCQSAPQEEMNNNGKSLYPLPTDIAEADQGLWGGAVTELIQEQEFQAKLNTTVATRLGADIRKVVLTGMGTVQQASLDTLRRAAANGLRQAHALKSKQVGLLLPSVDMDLAATIQAVVEGSLLVAHQDNRFKSQNGSGESNNTFSVEDVTLILPEGVPETAAYTRAIQQAQDIAAGTILARELVAAPANIVTPITLAETARKLAEDFGLTAEILGYEECAALGMGAFLGVAQASDLPPQFIHLTYKPEGEAVAKLALVGKGLTFDSGGLNIKTDSRSIAMMKTDMGGSAAVLGAARALAALKPQVELHFIVAATENMISGRALHPGDILTASNRKTIEINNTDAEGRLTLADALVFAEKLEVDAIVDLATLTGACVVALGDDMAGLFTQNEAMAQQLQQAASQTGEKFWRMPMEESYFEGLSSVVADMKNTGPRPGGAITAALFLKQFVEKTPWMHLDIAGPVWTERDSGYTNKGGTGFAVRTLVTWVLEYQKTVTLT
jgi:leucyl aminopeptidase